MRAARRKAGGRSGALLFAAVVFAGCGGSPSGPGPVSPAPAPNVTPPSNAAPTIQSIAVQSTRERAPANFADVGEAVPVTADVKDEDTPLDRLQFNWSAPLGTFSGTGPSVTWQAPPQAAAPTEITVTLEVLERYGTAPSLFEHRVSRTVTLSLHDSVKEVGDMARQFLLDFSDSSLRDVDYIMRNFGNASTCPDVREVDNERSDVVKDRRDFQIVGFRIGAPRVTVNFGGSCPFRGKRGDACAVVPSYWQSIELATKRVGAVDGEDILAAAYSASGGRWWLCSSDYDGRRVSGATLRGFRALR
jgi:hypothetical protein